MRGSRQQRWLSTHRGWEDFCVVGLGLLIVLSPMLAGAEIRTAVETSTGMVGILIIWLALLELMAFQRWDEYTQLAAGIWIATSPVILSYGGTLRVWHVVLGLAVAALALLELWQDRHRKSII